MSVKSLIVDRQLIEMYKDIFPEIAKQSLNECDLKNAMNGIFKDQAQWFGIKINDQIVAFCTIGFYDQKVILYNVGVQSNYRRQGYGSQLICEIINQYPSKEIFLFVEKNNRPAINLYRKFNFEYIDMVFQSPPGQICLHKPLKSIHGCME